MTDQDEINPKRKIKKPNTPLSEEEHIEPPSFSLATLGLQRVGTVPPPKPAPIQPRLMLNARGMPARIRKRNKLFFDDDIINDDKPLRMSLSPRKIPPKIPISPSANKSPSKILKKRKGIVSRYMRPEEKVLPPSSSMDRIPTKSSSSSQPNSSSSKTSLRSLNQSSSTKMISKLSHIIPADKEIGQSIGMRLRNLLKLPKAHKWVIFEWFYSFVDKPLLVCDNEFQICLNTKFPNLETRFLAKADWQKIRSMLGKPRRCSPAFLLEERKELERRRQKIRYMQTRKSGDFRDKEYLRDLPNEIPLPLPLGTKVTARLRVPQDGIFSGVVDAFDSLTSTYRVTFDRMGLGTHSIPDFELVSEDFNEMLPLHSITKDFRPNLISVLHNKRISPTPKNFRNVRCVPSGHGDNLNKSDPLLSQEIIESPMKFSPVLGRNNVNGYPIKLLEMLVRLKRAMNVKRSKLQRLNDMNNEAELKTSQQLSLINNNSNSSSDDSINNTESILSFSEEFQRRYASIVISMEKMNRDIQDYLNNVQLMANELTREPQIQAMLAPSYLREKCREAAHDAVERNNQNILKNQKILDLIRSLSTVLLVASHLGEESNSSQVSKVLEGCLEEVRASLSNVNVATFQKSVQLYLHHIRLGIGQSMLTKSNSLNVTPVKSDKKR